MPDGNSFSRKIRIRSQSVWVKSSRKAFRELDAVGAAAEAQDQLPELPGEDLPLRLRGRVLEGDFRLGMGRGDPFQDGVLVGVVLGGLTLETVQEKRGVTHPHF